MSKPGSSLVALACAGLIWPAVAAEDPIGSGPMTQQQVRKMDANKDGVISKREYAKLSSDTAAWSEMDANDDGVLDEAEQRRNTRPAPIRVR